LSWSVFTWSINPSPQRNSSIGNEIGFPSYFTQVPSGGWDLLEYPRQKLYLADNSMREEDEPIRLLGDPCLRSVCDPVCEFQSDAFKREGERLLRALERFRAEWGFGRAIAAPQIGIMRRMIAMNLGQGPFLIVNPVISALSAETFTLWDDCMSFPWIMVRLRRHSHLNLSWQNVSGEPQQWTGVDQAVSELVQHETDHLDGVLAVDHALDRDAIVARDLYERQRETFNNQVDYAIVPTIAKRSEE
jgi:peptide deformylase